MIEDENITIDVLSNPSPKMQKLIEEERQQKLRNWDYYQNIKKENLTTYLSAKVQAQLQADAIALGPAFGMPND
jgi:hypothetical protein